MTPRKHIEFLRRLIGTKHVYAEYLEDFAEEHHVGMDQWFEKEWADLLLAETPKEKEAALHMLAEQYERLEFKENET
jgi:hypothetical protein